MQSTPWLRNNLFIAVSETERMTQIENMQERATQPCSHRWQYYVDVQSRKVRSRRCERCGAEQALSRRPAEVARKQRLSA